MDNLKNERQAHLITPDFCLEDNYHDNNVYTLIWHFQVKSVAAVVKAPSIHAGMALLIWELQS